MGQQNHVAVYSVNLLVKDVAEYFRNQNLAGLPLLNAWVLAERIEQFIGYVVAIVDEQIKYPSPTCPHPNQQNLVVV